MHGWVRWDVPGEQSSSAGSNAVVLCDALPWCARASAAQPARQLRDTDVRDVAVDRVVVEVYQQRAITVDGGTR